MLLLVVARRYTSKLLTYCENGLLAPSMTGNRSFGC